MEKRAADLVGQQLVNEGFKSYMMKKGSVAAW